MATTSNSGSVQKQPASSSSRFASTLKVFKFAAGSSKHSTPPIPPPKENHHYHHNHNHQPGSVVTNNNSCLSLLPDPPTTPLTPDYNYTRSQSTPPFLQASNSSNVVHHSPSLSSQDPGSASSSSSVSTSTSTGFGKGLMKFAKRSLTPKSATRQLSESSEDSSISLPWGFQVCLISSFLIVPLFCYSIYATTSCSFRFVATFFIFSYQWPGIMVVDAAFFFLPFFALSCSITCTLTKGKPSLSHAVWR